MSREETGFRARREPGDTILDRRSAEAGPTWEALAWGILLSAAALLRFYGLGERAMSHDEAQHVYFSYDYFVDGIYHHSPLTHGPFLFHLNALLFRLLGANDFVARLGPALAGTALVGAMYFLRTRIGRFGALAAGLILTISPSFLFYGRYIRNDVYIALFSVGWLYAAWRYLERRDPKHLRTMTIWMALAFATKETGFIFGAIIGSFFLIWTLASRRPESGFPEGPLTLAATMASLALPFCSPLIHLALGWSVTDYNSADAFPRAVVALGVTVLLGACVLVSAELAQPRGARRGMGNRFREWLPCALIFWGITLLLYTSLFTNWPDGLVSGWIGSLGFWLTQQSVGRGDQPIYYYLALAVLYEGLPLLLGCLGTISGFRILSRGGVSVSPAPADTAGTGNPPDARFEVPFVGFLIWWAAGAWIGYSIAGEKMPWLLTQIVLPMALLGAWWLDRFLASGEILKERRQIAIASLTTIACLAAVRIFRADPFLGQGLEQVAETGRFLVASLVLLLAVWLSVRFAWGNARTAFRNALLGLLFFLTAAAVVTSYRLSFLNFDLATEFLVYAHGTPDIKKTIRELKAVERLNPVVKLTVGYDDEATWPLGWYVRRNFKSVFYGHSPDLADLREDAILLAGENDERAKAVLPNRYRRTVGNLIWWPLPIEKAFTADSLRQRRGDLQFDQWPYRKEFALYLKRDLLPRAHPGLQAIELPDVLDVFEPEVAGQRLQGPRGLAAGPDGAVVVADSGNHRIVMYRGRQPALAFGSECSLIRSGGRGCVDPDGAGPLESGDGQFDEPWGVACDREGRIYVADTWNGRVQVFDRDGRFLRKWGSLSAATASEGNPLSMFGPRGIAIDTEGNLLVTDTGNCRILRFSRDGAPLAQIGGSGSLPGQFKEPVGLAVRPDSGEVLVAEAWNRRIQEVTPQLEFSRMWAVPGWSDEGPDAKPFLAVDGDGNIFATDPADSRLLVLCEPDGKPRELVPDPEKPQVKLPTGIAVDPAGRRLLLADTGNNRIVAFALDEIISRVKKAARD